MRTNLCHHDLEGFQNKFNPLSVNLGNKHDNLGTGTKEHELNMFRTVCRVSSSRIYSILLTSNVVIERKKILIFRLNDFHFLNQSDDAHSAEKLTIEKKYNKYFEKILKLLS